MDTKNSESNPSSEVTQPHIPIPGRIVSKDPNPTLLNIPAAPASSGIKEPNKEIIPSPVSSSESQQATKPNFFSRLKNKILPK